MHHGCQRHTALLEILESLRGAQRPHGLLNCSFRHFTRVQAIHGRSEAERLIAAGTARLQSVCPPSATLMRLSDGELAAVIPEALNSDALLELAERCSQQCRALETQPESIPLLLSVAIGAAMADSNSVQSSDDLIHQALLARCEAERHAGNRVVLAPPQMQHLAAQRYRLESDLHLALERHELTTHLQPIVTLDDGRAIGFECLARWPSAVGETRVPASFLATANDSGITAEIDLQVLRLALEAAPALAAAAGSNRALILSANLSGQLIENPQRVLELLELIKVHPLPASVQLQVELLEDSFNNASYDLDALLDWLSEMKVLIAIDDFGTGYSSLSRLHDLSINTIKIDRSFVQRLDAAQKPSNHLLQTLVAIGKDLQLAFTAEGVETDAQRQWLLNHGIHHGQGYLFSEPLCLNDAIAYLQQQS